jgi:hypothetical protein
MPVKLFGTTTIVLLLLAVQGCEKREERPIEAKSVNQPYERFLPIHREPSNLTGVPWSGAFGLDTKTGQLCHTYPIDGDQQVKKEYIPRCLDLYKIFPD